MANISSIYVSLHHKTLYNTKFSTIFCPGLVQIKNSKFLFPDFVVSQNYKVVGIGAIIISEQYFSCSFSNTSIRKQAWLRGNNSHRVRPGPLMLQIQTGGTSSAVSSSSWQEGVLGSTARQWHMSINCA